MNKGRIYPGKVDQHNGIIECKEFNDLLVFLKNEEQEVILEFEGDDKAFDRLCDSDLPE